MDPKNDLKTILGLHRAWLAGEYCGRRADLRGFYLRAANLRGADLRRADLRGADLCDADLDGADLRGADLSGAYLCRADLRGTDLYYADLRGADLCDADLSGAKGAALALAVASHLPEGDIIGWKKCADGVVVKLRIPANAKRSHGASRECRAEFAEVLEVIGAEVGHSTSDAPHKLEYRAGETVYPDSFCEDRWQTCAPGIHFYITRAEAEAH